MVGAEGAELIYYYVVVIGTLDWSGNARNNRANRR
jgi:hypothetical protein